MAENVFKLRKDFENIKKERLLGTIRNNTDDKIMEISISVPDTKNCLKKLSLVFLTVFLKGRCFRIFIGNAQVKPSCQTNLVQFELS